MKKNIWIFLSLVTLLSGCKNGGTAPASSSSSSSASLVALSVSPSNQFIAKSSQLKFKSVGTYSDASLADVSGIVWTVNDASISSINTAGLLVNTWAGGVNNATRELIVTATHAASGLSATTKVTVVSASLSNIVINPTAMTVAPGSKVNYTVTANISDGSTLDVTNTVNASVNNASATVVPGVLTGVNVGTGTISVSYNGLNASTGYTVEIGRAHV